MTTVVISGANRGLGLEFARQYARDGARVIAGARDPAGATALKHIEQISEDRVTVHALDVADPASIADFRRAAGEAAVGILIANAGVYGGSRQHRLGDIDYDDWLRTFAVNTLGPVRLAEAFLPNLKAGREKKLIAITSGMGSTAQNGGGYFAYRSSKAALNNAWRTLAQTLKSGGFVCVVISPGWVKTDMGGPGAPLTPEQSIGGMRKLIAGLKPGDSGKFFDWDGGELPW